MLLNGSSEIMIRIFPHEGHRIHEEANISLPHILLVLDQFPEILGGGERIVIRLANLLPKYGYRVSILTFAIHPKSNALKQVTCPVYLLPLQRTYDITAFRAAFALGRFLKINRIEIVQTFFESSDLWAGFVTKTMSNAKLIWSRRDMGILRTSKHRIGYRLMASSPDAVFAVSEEVRKHCIDVDKIDPNRTFTIYNGIDIANWINTPKPTRTSDKLHITTVGNIRRVKGHDIFIKAAASILKNYPSAQFSIAGDVLEQTYFAELQRLIQELNIGNRFHFVGGITDLHRHLLTADIFVLPSRSEGFSNAIVEAMAAELPIIATSVGGNTEAVINALNGFVIPREDPEALSETISRLLSDPSQAKTMGKAGRELVIEKFTTEAMMKKIVDVYDALLSGKVL
jgi:glycosyltransferase involved in cell wall biosynthesis